MDFKEGLRHLVREALQEDVGDGDHSTLSCIPADARGRAVLKIKQEGVLAGVDVAREIFSYKYPGSRFDCFKNDGERMEAGEKAFEVEAPVHVILQCERLVLNCMQRMSGIATLTRKYVERINGYHTRILDTRKTTPNFRLLEKEAVRIGGGVNHRFGLYDMIMLKDNHIDYCGGIELAVERAYDYTLSLQRPIRIEVETRNLGDVKKLMAVGRGKVARILLDNLSPEQLGEAMTFIRKEAGSEFETEASGGIHLENVEAYAKSGVDYVSIGALIHQAKSLDLSLKAVKD